MTINAAVLLACVRSLFVLRMVCDGDDMAEEAALPIAIRLEEKEGTHKFQRREHSGLVDLPLTTLLFN